MTNAWRPMSSASSFRESNLQERDGVSGPLSLSQDSNSDFKPGLEPETNPPRSARPIADVACIPRLKEFAHLQSQVVRAVHTQAGTCPISIDSACYWIVFDGCKTYLEQVFEGVETPGRMKEHIPSHNLFFQYAQLH